MLFCNKETSEYNGYFSACAEFTIFLISACWSGVLHDLECTWEPLARWVRLEEAETT